uniref:ectonucleoside triphosphate diphosphohydrolase 8-like n=1 Tax=Myxine glutinosa TaxID=7769 RepID=UPI0035901B76
MSCLEEVMSVERRPVGLMIILGITSMMMTIVCIVLVAQDAQPSQMQYGVVIDAGSTHTALFVYHWPGGKENGTGTVSQRSRCPTFVPGISTFASNPEGAAKAMRPCLVWALTEVPRGSRTSCPLYLGATAGMRLLNAKNISSAKKVMEAVQVMLSSFPFDFRGAKVITGSDEGAFGWITLNYLLERLIWFDWSGQWVHDGSTNTVGSMDLGGASTQLVFVSNTNSFKNSSDFLSFRLYGQNYNVYTHSYQCYGLNESLRMHLASLWKGAASEVENPCFLLDYRINLTSDFIFGSPCTSFNGTGLMPGVGETKVFVGSGDSVKCRHSIEALFNFSSCGLKANCSFNGVFQPNLQGHFTAFSGYYYTMKNLNLTDEFGSSSLHEFNATLGSFCSLTWVQVDPDMMNLCFSGNYIYTLLIRGYKFDEKSWRSIKFSNKVGSTELGWSLGYMLNLTNLLPPESLSSASLTTMLALLVTVFLVCAAIVAASLLLLSRASQYESV